MDKAHAILIQKERDLVRLKRELEALRMVAPLLRDEDDQVAELDGNFITQFARGLFRRLAKVRTLRDEREDLYDATQDFVGRRH